MDSRWSIWKWHPLYIHVVGSILRISLSLRAWRDRKLVRMSSLEQQSHSCVSSYFNALPIPDWNDVCLSWSLSCWCVVLLGASSGIDLRTLMRCSADVVPEGSETCSPSSSSLAWLKEDEADGIWDKWTEGYHLLSKPADRLFSGNFRRRGDLALSYEAEQQSMMRIMLTMCMHRSHLTIK